MDKLLSNPQALIALLCVAGLVIGINLALFSALGQGKVLQKQAEIWGKAIGGGAEIRKQQNSQLDELHQRVQQLKAKTEDDEEESDS
ncbi:MAG: hypothetical protein HYZ49_05150 [Chloroflexi bacterium]|nr:hypothetical protein [Chloroflexota bacterium]